MTVTRRQGQAMAQAGARKRQITIRNLIANIVANTGVPPSHAEIASLLATSVRKVRRHLQAQEKS